MTMKTTTSTRYSSKKLLLLLGLSSSQFSALAFQQSLVPSFGRNARQTSTRVWGRSQSHVKESTALQEPETLTRKASSLTKYDLGLGKNQPLFAAATYKKSDVPIYPTNDSNATATTIEVPSENDIHQAVEFLVDHQGAMAYPSPSMVMEHRERLLQAAAAVSTTTTTDTQQKQQQPLPRVSFAKSRVSLPIVSSDSDSHYVVDKASTSDLDLNTAWVELLMLEQQKLLAATAAAH
ncbi:hypothetical protein MPSEU_000867600 [Mayamaea pseudoterrestris]|nr:hypothetical protein MPSEU_000867600 [Mayamaea pseudoterrestris]